MSNKTAFKHLGARHFAAILLTLVTATVMIPGMATYLPLQMTDKIGVPIFAFPFIWVGLFIYCYMAKKSWHPYVVLMLLLLSHIALSFFALQ